MKRSSTARMRKMRALAIGRGDCARCGTRTPRPGLKTCDHCIRATYEAFLDAKGKSPRELMRWADDGGRV